MIELAVPGRGVIQIEHLVCDVNGTLAIDGRLAEGVEDALNRLRAKVQIHLVTANTHGAQDEIDQRLNLPSERLDAGDEANQKARIVQRLGSSCTAVIGNGANDAGMLSEAALGVCVLSPEGLSLEALQAADILAPDIQAALDLFLKPLRIVATLRK
jgi:P-type E1-E2 ATPase